jgi:membrane-associated phospholipid phosphatase
VRLAIPFIERRPSSISATGFVLILIFSFAAAIASLATGLTFSHLPSVLLLTVGAAVLDLLCRLAPRTPIINGVQTIIYGILYLAMTCWCGILTAYATQRLSFPLQDGLFETLDRALGLNWLEAVRWIDRHPVLNEVLAFAYNTMSAQIALPVVVLGILNQVYELRKYLVSFAIALMITTVVAAFLPVLSHIAFIDRASFSSLKFTGATPVDHLAQLRLPGPTLISGNVGGLLGFPSFHATVAILTPLVLRRYRAIFLPLLLLDAAMLCSTVTEGAHYGCDVIAGACVAVTAYLLAGWSVEEATKSTVEPSPFGGYGAQPAS